ncbi:MAG: hypothetical protein KDI14_02540 [Halioglobus sp.]|nr:hypothetical protein [Halioglobus sp.]
MIEYVDRLLAHWAQEFSVRDAGVSLGYGQGWSGAALAEVSGSSGGAVTARGVASRPTSARSGVGKVAERVNQAVERLPEHLQKGVRVHYLEHPAAKVFFKAQLLGCSSRTFHRVIHMAHEQISSDLPDSYVYWRLTIHR